MIDKPEYVRTDILNKLKATHRDLEKMSPEDVRAVLEESIEIIRTLRDLIGIKEEIILEDMPPEGNA
jgi:hypothetical protein